VLTWPTLAWILEDCDLSKVEPFAVDFIYKRISEPWSYEPHIFFKSYMVLEEGST